MVNNPLKEMDKCCTKNSGISTMAWPDDCPLKCSGRSQRMKAQSSKSQREEKKKKVCSGHQKKTMRPINGTIQPFYPASQRFEAPSIPAVA
jgi:hypothetical protein